MLNEIIRRTSEDKFKKALNVGPTMNTGL